MLVAGKTVEAVEATVQAIVQAKTPDAGMINVRLVGRNSKVYYVLGQVNAPGSFPLQGRETVLDGIVAAGGLNTRASRSNIILSRPTVPDGCRIVLPVCYRQIVQLGDTTTNYQLQPGDRIYVPAMSFWESTFGEDKDEKKGCSPCTGPQRPCPWDCTGPAAVPTTRRRSKCCRRRRQPAGETSEPEAPARVFSRAFDSLKPQAAITLTPPSASSTDAFTGSSAVPSPGRSVTIVSVRDRSPAPAAFTFTVSTCTGRASLLSPVATVTWSSVPLISVILNGCGPRRITRRSAALPIVTAPNAAVAGLRFRAGSTSTVSGTRMRGEPALFVFSHTSVYHLPTGVSGRRVAVTS